MAAPSPTCTVKDGAGAAAVPTNGADLTPGQTCTIALQSAAGVNVWTLTCIGTDETTTPATVNAAVTVNSTTKTATFTAPAAGKSYLFRSTVQGPDGVEYSTTFKVSTLTSAGYRVGATGEKLENHSTAGWIGLVNTGIRAAGSTMTAATLTAANGTNTKTVTGSFNTLNCSGSPTAIWTLELTSDANSRTFVYNGTSYGVNVKYPGGTSTYVAAGKVTGFTRFGNEQLPDDGRNFGTSRYPQLDANHICAWDLSDAAGTATVANQGSGGTANGTVGSGVTFGQSMAPWGGSAAYFDGTSNAAITLPNTLPGLTGGVLAAYSAEFWVRNDGGGTTNYILSLYDSSGSDLFRLGFSSSIAYLQMRAGSDINTASSGNNKGTRNAGVWQYVSMTYDGTNARLYFDGKQSIAVALTGNQVLSISTPTWRIGRGNAAQYTQGDVGLVRFSNIVRSASYFQGVYNRVMGWAH